MYGEAYLNWQEAKEIADDLVPKLRDMQKLILELTPEVVVELHKILRKEFPWPEPLSPLLYPSPLALTQAQALQNQQSLQPATPCLGSLYGGAFSSAIFGRGL